jgi:DNA topoisomerase-1
MTKVVIVESPTKARTIGKYLGNDYSVIASYGHVRDLPSKPGSVNPDEDFAMIWQSDERAQKQVNALIEEVKKADEIYLATDPDREGEAISWHIYNILKEKKLLSKAPIKRVVFNEITSATVKQAFESPRDVDTSLVEAYLARLSLDYLVGFTISPLLWRKLPGARSAGRVQSVALRLIVERERDIDAFTVDEYWSITAQCVEKRKKFQAKLTRFNHEKLQKLSITNETQALDMVNTLKSISAYHVSSIERKESKRHPTAPFTTSTLQQEASRKLGFGATRSMKLAQQLYEGINLGGGETTGLITYMRTDSPHLSTEALSTIRHLIHTTYGDAYLPPSPRIFKSKSKNAQEAHEAIRPTDVQRSPEDMAKYLDKDQLKLYTLIWKRAVASQMSSAIFDKTRVQIADSQNAHLFQANGSIVKFEGFLALYQEGQDDVVDEDDARLPDLQEGQLVRMDDILPQQHFTQPPPRYSEASLVKSMEELGIGRPSTYASVLNVLKTRNYVTMDQKRFFPEDRGKLVTTFLEHFFKQYVQYDFTAQLETKLDHISDGELFWKDVLREFWTSFNKTVEGVKEKTIQDVIAVIEENMAHTLFAHTIDGAIDRSCPSCKEGVLGLRLSKYGAFVGCNRYPECKYTQKLQGDEESPSDGIDLGPDTDTGESIFIKRGPYGPYLQWGEGEKPKRSPIPAGYEVDKLTVQQAMFLKTLPRYVGDHPDTGLALEVGIGRFGPFVKYDGKYISIPKTDDIMTISVKRCLELIVLRAERDAKKAAKAAEKGEPLVAKKSAKKTATKKTIKKTAPKKTAPKKPALAEKTPAKKATKATKTL